MREERVRAVVGMDDGAAVEDEAVRRDPHPVAVRVLARHHVVEDEHRRPRTAGVARAPAPAAELEADGGRPRHLDRAGERRRDPDGLAREVVHPVRRRRGERHRLDPAPDPDIGAREVRAGVAEERGAPARALERHPRREGEAVGDHGDPVRVAIARRDRGAEEGERARTERARRGARPLHPCDVDREGRGPDPAPGHRLAEPDLDPDPLPHRPDAVGARVRDDRDARDVGRAHLVARARAEAGMREERRRPVAGIDDGAARDGEAPRRDAHPVGVDIVRLDLVVEDERGRARRRLVPLEGVLDIAHLEPDGGPPGHLDRRRERRAHPDGLAREVASPGGGRRGESHRDRAAGGNPRVGEVVRGVPEHRVRAVRAREREPPGELQAVGDHADPVRVVVARLDTEGDPQRGLVRRVAPIKGAPYRPAHVEIEHNVAAGDGAADLHRFAEPQEHDDLVAGLVEPVLARGAKCVRQDLHRRHVRPAHLVGGLRGELPEPARRRSRRSRAVGPLERAPLDPALVNGQPVPVVVPAHHLVAEVERVGAGAGDVLGAPRRVPDREIDARRSSRHLDGRREAHRRADRLPREVVHPVRRRRVDGEGGCLAASVEHHAREGMAALGEVELRGPAVLRLERDAGLRQFQRTPDLHAAPIDIGPLHVVAEPQRLRAAPTVTVKDHRPIAAPEFHVERKSRRRLDPVPEHGHRLVENRVEQEPLPGGVDPVLARVRGVLDAGDVGLRRPRAVDLVPGLRPEAAVDEERVARAVGVGDRAAIEGEARLGHAHPVGVDVVLGHRVGEAQGRLRVDGLDQAQRRGARDPADIEADGRIPRRLVHHHRLAGECRRHLDCVAPRVRRPVRGTGRDGYVHRVVVQTAGDRHFGEMVRGVRHVEPAPARAFEPAKYVAEVERVGRHRHSVPGARVRRDHEAQG